jgi:hypothetical protein
LTLGGAIGELERLGMRKDFVTLLRKLNEFRIDMAHNFLVDRSSLVALDRSFGQLSRKPLQTALFKVEETVHVYDFLNQNKQLYKRQRKVFTILLVSSTMQTLVSLTDTSSPAQWSMLRFSF